jgi:hypothetical protein
MVSVECPWCAGSAFVGIADGDEFSCDACGLRVEIAPEPVPEPVARHLGDAVGAAA